MKRKIDICYLCGGKLTEGIDDDHVPPRQFYGKNIRKNHNPNLFSLPVHKLCNKSYQNDEDYFVHSLAPLAMESYSGGAVWADIGKKYKRPQGKKIGQMVLREFDQRPSGLILPKGKIVKRFNGERIWKVVWKITRGLVFKETGKFLSKDTPNLFRIFIDEEPSHEFASVRDTQSRGQYPGVFDYKYIDFPELNNFHFWAILLWDKIIVEIAFHDSECRCEKCKGNKQ